MDKRRIKRIEEITNLITLSLKKKKMKNEEKEEIARWNEITQRPKDKENRRIIFEDSSSRIFSRNKIDREGFTFYPNELAQRSCSTGWQVKLIYNCY